MPKVTHQHRGYPFQLFLSKRQREVLELLSQDRLVAKGEIGSTDKAAYRLIERLRQSLRHMEVPAGIMSIQGEGYILVVPEAKPNGGHPQPMDGLERRQQLIGAPQ